jgi:enoyl-CoA hydratase
MQESVLLKADRVSAKDNSWEEVTMKKIQYQLENEIATIRMDDGKANAMNFAFFEEMNQSLDRLENDGAKTLIITGRLGYFSAGLDIKLMPSLPPTEVNALADTFARTLLRVFSLPVPTIALCSGHAVAGGAMLFFACDLRFVIDGPYRIQMNEMMIGIPLPSWMLLIGRFAVPAQVFIEALLHARAFTPEEAVEKAISHGLIKQDEDALAFVMARTGHLKALNSDAYRTSKNRLRATEVEGVLRLLKDELPFTGL